MLWLSLLIVLMLLFGVNWWLKHEDFEKIPGPKGFFLLENALDFLFLDPVEVFNYYGQLASEYKDWFKLKLGPKKFIHIYKPEDVEVVISGTKNIRKGYLYRFLRPWLRDGLLLSDGSKWQHRRKILTYAFHFKILRHFNSIIEENTKKLVEQLQSELCKPKTNILPFIHEFSLNTICETAMGTKLNSETSDIGKRYRDGIYEFGRLLVYRIQRVWMHSNFIFSLTNTGRRQKEIIELFTTFRDSVVNKRRETHKTQKIIDSEYDDDNNDEINPGKKRLVMLDLLLQAEKEGAIDSKGIGEEVDTFIFEGHDTTATSLQYTLMLLANNQEAQDKVVEECNQIFGSSTTAATMDDLSQMKYLDCCIKESLRLYPPVYYFIREIDQDIKLHSYVVPAGTDCAILTIEMHRRSDQFVEPLAFRPERFLAEPTWHPYAYIPFSAGPRNCIGQKFAMMEMKLVLSAVLRRYRVLPVTKQEDIIHAIDFLLRNRDPIYVRFEKRI